MMLPERWLVAAVLGLTLSLASMAASVFGQQNGAKPSSQSGTSANGQAVVPAKAVPDPNAPPPDDPQAQPARKDDDLAPEPDADSGEDAQGSPAPKPAQSQNPGPPQNGSDSAPAPVKAATGESAPKVDAPITPASKDGDQKTATPQVAGTANPTPKTQEPERHSKYDKEMVELVSLTQELKTEVEKAGANTLSLAALRKADEIQKVAKDLKEKMKEQAPMVASKP
jgi:hypothetical protein